MFASAFSGASGDSEAGSSRHGDLAQEVGVCSYRRPTIWHGRSYYRSVSSSRPWHDEVSGCISAGVEWIAPQPFCLRQSGYFCCWPYCPLRAIGQVVTLTSRTATRSSSAIMTDDRRDIGAAKVPEPVSGVLVSIGIAHRCFEAAKTPASTVSQVTAPFSVID